MNANFYIVGQIPQVIQTQNYILTQPNSNYLTNIAPINIVNISNQPLNNSFQNLKEYTGIQEVPEKNYNYNYIQNLNQNRNTFYQFNNNLVRRQNSNLNIVPNYSNIINNTFTNENILNRASSGNIIKNNQTQIFRQNNNNLFNFNIPNRITVSEQRKIPMQTQSRYSSKSESKYHYINRANLIPEYSFPIFTENNIPNVNYIPAKPIKNQINNIYTKGYQTNANLNNNFTSNFNSYVPSTGQNYISGKGINNNRKERENRFVNKTVSNYGFNTINATKWQESLLNSNPVNNARQTEKKNLNENINNNLFSNFDLIEKHNTPQTFQIKKPISPNFTSDYQNIFNDNLNNNYSQSNYESQRLTVGYRNVTNRPGLNEQQNRPQFQNQLKNINQELNNNSISKKLPEIATVTKISSVHTIINNNNDMNLINNLGSKTYINTVKKPSINTISDTQINPVNNTQINPVNNTQMNPINNIQINQMNTQINQNNNAKNYQINNGQINQINITQINPINNTQINQIGNVEINPINNTQINQNNDTKLETKNNIQVDPNNNIDIKFDQTVNTEDETKNTIQINPKANDQDNNVTLNNPIPQQDLTEQVKKEKLSIKHEEESQIISDIEKTELNQKIKEPLPSLPTKTFSEKSNQKLVSKYKIGTNTIVTKFNLNSQNQNQLNNQEENINKESERATIINDKVNDENINININKQKTNDGIDVRYSDFDGSGYVKNYGGVTRPGKDLSGKIKVNQDSIVCLTNINNIKDFNMFGVLDGHGPDGHYVSEFISEFIPSKLANHPKIKNLKNPEEIYREYKSNNCQIITQAFLEADKELENVQFDTTESGTTCCLIIHIGTHIMCANTGDSRALVIFDDSQQENSKSLDYLKAVPLSIDYKPEIPEETNRIIMSGGVVEQMTDELGEGVGPMRVWAKNEDYPGLAMSRSIGDLNAKTVGVIPDPGIFEYDLNKTTKFVIVCSDGVWEFLNNENVKNIGKKFYEENNASAFCHNLVAKSYELWETNDQFVDDISAVVAFF